MLEAVRKIKAFENATNSEIEGPMKIYLAGAAFRKKNSVVCSLTILCTFNFYIVAIYI